MQRKQPYFSIGTGRRTDFTNSVENLMKPGPNTYLPPMRSVTRSEPSFSIGKELRTDRLADKRASAAPCASKYLTKADHGHRSTISITFGHETREKKGKSVVKHPDPTAYNPH
jgi:hypothetical protein